MFVLFLIIIYNDQLNLSIQKILHTSTLYIPKNVAE